MSTWPQALLAAAERIARERPGTLAASLDALANAAARLGLRDEALRMATEVQGQGGLQLANAARIHAALGDHASVDRLRAQARLDAASDPGGAQAWTFAAAYQQLGDDAQADGIINAIGNRDARSAGRAVLTHAALAAARPPRAASLARAVASDPVPAGGALGTVLALAAGSHDRATAAHTAPIAQRAAQTLGKESRDEPTTEVARLWLTAGKPDEALGMARGRGCSIATSSGTSRSGPLRTRHARRWRLPAGAAPMTRGTRSTRPRNSCRRSTARAWATTPAARSSMRTSPSAMWPPRSRSPSGCPVRRARYRRSCPPTRL